MTRPGIWKHWKGALYRVLFNARQATNGTDEGKLVVVYIDLKYGGIHVRDEEQFHQRLFKDTGNPADGDLVNMLMTVPENVDKFAAVTVDRFTFTGTMANEMSDADADELYSGLHETFTGRKPAP